MEGSGGGAVRDKVQCAEGVHTVHEGGVLTCREERQEIGVWFSALC